MKIRTHILIISFLLMTQFFITDIYHYFVSLYLPHIEKQVKSKDSKEKVYKKSEYTPVSNEAPKDYEFVVVKKSNYMTTKTFYSKEGTRIEIVYGGGKWNATYTDSLLFNPYPVFPIIGFCLFFFATFHYRVRTDEIFSLEIKYPFDEVEKISLLYGIPLFVSGIVFGWLGRF